MGASVAPASRRRSSHLGQNKFAGKMPALLPHDPLVFRTRGPQFNPYFLRLSSSVFRLMPRIAALLLIL
jgi:hypothetical protein